MNSQKTANATVLRKQIALKENCVRAFAMMLFFLLICSSAKLFSFEQPFSFEQQIGASVSPSGNSLVVANKHEVRHSGSETSTNRNLLAKTETTVYLEFMGVGKTKPLKEKISQEQGSHHIIDVAWTYDSSVLAFRLQNRLHILRISLRQSELGKPHLEEFGVTEENEFLSSFCWPDAGEDDPRSLLLVLKRFCSEDKESKFSYGTDKGKYDRVRVVRLDINSGQIRELLNHDLKSPLPCSYNFLNAPDAWNEISPTASHVFVEDADSWNLYKFDSNKDTFTFYKKISAKGPIDAVWWINPQQIIFGSCLFISEKPRFYQWNIQTEKAENVSDILAPDGNCDRLYTGGNLCDWLRNTLLDKTKNSKTK